MPATQALSGADVRDRLEIVDAQHVRAGNFALLKNLYATELSRDGARWVLERVRIENVWFQGEPAVVFSE